MATAAQTPYLSVEEYLNTTYRPDVDYIDGHIEERNLGEFDHGDLQSALAAILRFHQVLWNIRVVSETRVQVSLRNYRVPDLCVTDVRLPREAIIRTAPMLCIEILSRRDSFKEMRLRCEDYLRMGVPEVWIFDPKKRTATVCTSANDTAFLTGIIHLPQSEIAIDVDQVFSTLDR